MAQHIQDESMERLWPSPLLGGCTLILTSGLFLYVIIRGLCIKMKNVVRIGTGTPICLFADKYPHHWTYIIIHIYLFPLKYLISLERLGFSSQGRKYYPIHPVL